MAKKFKTGEIVIIQGHAGEAARYNGVEVQILDVRQSLWLGTVYTISVPHPEGGFYDTLEHHLRRRRPPPSGWQKIRAMFGAPPVDQRRPVTAWQAQYDTAQALMQMGVRVRPGKWPVESLPAGEGA